MKSEKESGAIRGPATHNSTPTSNEANTTSHGGSSVQVSFWDEVAGGKVCPRPENTGFTHTNHDANMRMMARRIHELDRRHDHFGTEFIATTAKAVTT
jgi:hypothetical protein